MQLNFNKSPANQLIFWLQVSRFMKMEHKSRNLLRKRSVVIGFVALVVLALLSPCTAKKRFFTVNDALTRLDSGDMRPSSAHVWSDWRYCPLYKFVNQMRIQHDETLTFVTGLQFGCNDGPDSNNTRIEINYQNRSDLSELQHHCRSTRRAIGFQLNVVHLNSSSNSRRLHTADLFCLSREESLSYRFSARGPEAGRTRDLVPQLCPRGEYVCGVRAKALISPNEITDINMRCCRGEPGEQFIRSSPSTRNAISRVLETQLTVHGLHYFADKQFDSPYWHDWRFCPSNTYVVGMQLAHMHRKLRFLCAPAADLNAIVAIEDRDANEDDVETKRKMCAGFAIGFQVEVSLEQGITNVRILCSGTAEDTLQTYADEEGFLDSPTQTFVGRPQFCKRNEAICGFKMIREKRPPLGSLLWNLLDLKVKCCKVPDIASLCSPSDEFELIVECDASEALAYTTCSYKKRIGRSVTNSISRNERSERDVRKGLSYERTVSVGRSLTQTSSVHNGTSQSASVSQSNTNTAGQNMGQVYGQMEAQSSSSSNSTSRGQSESSSKTDGKHMATSQSTGSTNTEGKDHTAGTVEIDSRNWRAGTLSSNSISNGKSLTKGSSQSQSRSRTAESSSSSSHGTSESDSQSQGNSVTDRETSSTSSSSTDSRSSAFSSTIGASLEVEVSASASIPFTASLSTTMRAGLSTSMTASSERSRSHTSGQSNERGRDQSRSSGSEQTRASNTQNTRGTSNSHSEGSASEVHEGSVVSQSSDTTSSQSKDTGGEAASHSSNQQNIHSSSSTNDQKSTDYGTTHSATDALETSQVSSGTHSVDQTHQTTHQSTLEENRGTSNTISKDASLTTDSRTGSELSTGRTDNAGQTQGENENIGYTTGYEWSRATSEVFSEETEVEVHLTVPAGMVTKLYQVVGHCSYYAVRANVFKRVDNGEDAYAVLDHAERIIERARVCEVELQQCHGNLTAAGV